MGRLELTPRKIGKPKHRWLPAYYGSACFPPKPPYGDGIDTYRASYCDENNEWHVLFEREIDEWLPNGNWMGITRDIHTMTAWLCHLYEVEKTPELLALAERICTDKYGWTICKLERTELIKLVEQNLHVQGEMF